MSEPSVTTRPTEATATTQARPPDYVADLQRDVLAPIAETVAMSPFLQPGPFGIPMIAQPSLRAFEASAAPLPYDPVEGVTARAQGDIADLYGLNIVPSTSAQFAGAGTFGGSAHRQMAGFNQFSMERALADARASAEFAANQQELARRGLATQAAPGVAGTTLAAAGFPITSLADAIRAGQAGHIDSRQFQEGELIQFGPSPLDYMLGAAATASMFLPKGS